MNFFRATDTTHTTIWKPGLKTNDLARLQNPGREWCLSECYLIPAIYTKTLRKNKQTIASSPFIFEIKLVCTSGNENFVFIMANKYE